MKLLWLTVAPLDEPGFRSTQFGMGMALERLGWKVHLMGKTSSAEIFEGYDGFQGEVTLMPRRGRLSTEIFYHKKLWQLLLLKNMDIVMFEPAQLRLIALPALFSRVGLLQTIFILDVRTPLVEEAIHDKIERLNYWLTMKFAKWFLPGVTVITETLRRDLELLWGCKIPVLVWGSGVDTEMFDPETVSTVSKSILKLENRFIFLHHGSLSVNKGIQLLIEAMKPLMEISPAAALIILGDGPAKAELLAMVKDLSLEDSVIFIDSVPNQDVPGYIAMADVGVIPIPEDHHWQVSSPLKLFEYMAMGLPVIVSNIEAHRSVLGKLSFAIYVDVASRDNYYKAMKLAIENIKELKLSAVKGRSIAVGEHSWVKRAVGLSEYFVGFLRDKKTGEIGLA